MRKTAIILKVLGNTQFLGRINSSLNSSSSHVYYLPSNGMSGRETIKEVEVAITSTASFEKKR